jgi:hypothetical protein
MIRIERSERTLTDSAKRDDELPEDREIRLF